MQSIKTKVANSLIIIALLCSVAFAQGEQGSGGFTAGEEPIVCVMDGEQGSGGATKEPCEEEEDEGPGYVDSFFTSIYTYFDGTL